MKISFKLGIREYITAAVYVAGIFIFDILSIQGNRLSMFDLLIPTAILILFLISGLSKSDRNERTNRVLAVIGVGLTYLVLFGTMIGSWNQAGYLTAIGNSASYLGTIGSVDPSSATAFAVVLYLLSALLFVLFVLSSVFLILSLSSGKSDSYIKIYRLSSFIMLAVGIIHVFIDIIAFSIYWRYIGGISFGHDYIYLLENIFSLLVLSALAFFASRIAEKTQTPAIKASSQFRKDMSEKDKADLLKSYKDLLDSGGITQEEFDAKKKEIL